MLSSSFFRLILFLLLSPLVVGAWAHFGCQLLATHSTKRFFHSTFQTWFHVKITINSFLPSSILKKTPALTVPCYHTFPWHLTVQSNRLTRVQSVPYVSLIMLTLRSITWHDVTAEWMSFSRTGTPGKRLKSRCINEEAAPLSYTECPKLYISILKTVLRFKWGG